MKNQLDKTFDICLLIVTVIAAAELQYVSAVFPDNPSSITAVFKWTTIPLLFIVTFWLILMVIPSISVKIGGLENFVNKRVGKEFCWALFGNFYVLEIITFWAISVSQDVTTTVLTGQWATALMFFLTLYVTWRYRKSDIYEMQKPNWKMGVITVGEHTILYVVSYLIVYLIMGYALFW